METVSDKTPCEKEKIYLTNLHGNLRTQMASYGSWKSPITPALLRFKSLRLGMTLLEGSDTTGSRGRPAEGSRNALVRRTADGTITDLLPTI